MKFGIREYHYTFPSGDQALTVAVVIDGQEVLRLPGHVVARLRKMLQAVEASHPTLVGTEGQLTKTELFDATVDPSKSTLN